MVGPDVGSYRAVTMLEPSKSMQFPNGPPKKQDGPEANKNRVRGPLWESVEKLSDYPKSRFSKHDISNH